jgi:acylglycerol lipase
LSSLACTLSLILVGHVVAQQRANHSAYGRYLLSAHPPELQLHKTPNLAIHHRRIFLHPSAPYDSTEIEYSEEVHLTAEELGKDRIRGGRWVYYKTLELIEPLDAEQGWEEGGKGRGVDLVLVHGALQLDHHTGD